MQRDVTDQLFYSPLPQCKSVKEQVQAQGAIRSGAQGYAPTRSGTAGEEMEHGAPGPLRLCPTRLPESQRATLRLNYIQCSQDDRKVHGHIGPLYGGILKASPCLQRFCTADGFDKLETRRCMYPVSHSSVSSQDADLLCSATTATHFKIGDRVKTCTHANAQM